MFCFFLKKIYKKIFIFPSEVWASGPYNLRLADIFRYSLYLLSHSLFLSRFSYFKILFTITFSFGVVMWEIASRAVPYQHVREKERFRRLLFQDDDLNLRPTMELVPESVPSQYNVLMRECWSASPGARPQNFSDIVVRLSDSRMSATGMLFRSFSFGRRDTSTVAPQTDC